MKRGSLISSSFMVERINKGFSNYILQFIIVSLILRYIIMVYTQFNFWVINVLSFSFSICSVSSRAFMMLPFLKKKKQEAKNHQWLALKLPLWVSGTSLICVFTQGRLQVQTDSPASLSAKITGSNLDYTFLKL